MKKSLLLVVANGGPPLDFCLPRLAKIADVHALVLVEPNSFNQKIIEEFSVSTHYNFQFEADRLDAVIVSRAEEISAEAILTFSEYALVSVARACQILGLKGPGTTANMARNKVLMREAWHKASLPSPVHHSIHSLEDLKIAYNSLTKPFILKDATGAGSVGCHIVTETDRLDYIYSKVTDTLRG